jgi:capsular polysaccharide biosynthesis protein
MYQASIKVLVGQKQEEAMPGTFAGDVMALQEITLTMAEAVDSRPVAEATIEELDLQTTPEALLGSMKVEPVDETQFIRIDYRDNDPEMARETANTVGEVFAEQVSEVSPSANAITATVWEPAVTPNAPVSPDPIRNTFLALVLGLMIGVALAFLLEHLDDRWRSPEEVEQVSGVPTFGVIRGFKVSKAARGAS